MKYQIAICDDRKEDAEYIASAVKQWAEENYIPVEVETFPSGESFLFRYEEKKDYDILLLDVEMKAISGMELARRIRRENDSVQIVFITGYPDYISEGYDVSALHYLMKPISAGKLSEVLNRAAEKRKKAEKAVFFTGESETLRVGVSEIISVEAFAHSCVITTARSGLAVRASISAIEKQLQEAAPEEFIRCHRSYIVGVRYIKSISKTTVTLDNAASIPLSRSRYQAVNQAFIRSFKGDPQWD